MVNGKKELGTRYLMLFGNKIVNSRLTHTHFYIKHKLLKPQEISQLAHEHFTTLCEWKFLASYKLGITNQKQKPFENTVRQGENAVFKRFLLKGR